MKSRTGKIILSSLLILLVTATLFVGYMAPRALAEGDRYVYTNTFMFRSTLTYPTIVFVEYPTGDVADLTTGTPAVAETFEANDKTADQHGESDFWTVTTPPLASNKTWVLCICDAAADDGAVETDLAKDTTITVFYNPATNTTTNADLSSSGMGIYTRQAPMQ